jgi:hypothetical protein
MTWLTVASFAVSLLTVWSSYGIRLKTRWGWRLSLWSQIPFAVTNLAAGLWPYLLFNAWFAWNAYRALVEWDAPRGRT